MQFKLFYDRESWHHQKEIALMFLMMKTKLKNVLKISSQMIIQINTLENKDINTLMN